MANRNNPVAGIGYFLRGFGLIVRPGIRRFVIVPLAINIVIFTAVVVFAVTHVGALLAATLPVWLDWLSWLLLPLLVLSMLIGAFFSFSLVANLIAAPFNGLLAEAVERELTGRDPGNSDWRKMLRELVQTFIGELKKLAYIAVRTVPLMFLLLVPGLNALASLALMGLGAWMMAIAYIDYPMGNHGLTFPEQRRRLGRKRYLGLGFGASVMAASTVPILNFLVIPTAVAGATALWVEQLEDGGSPGV